MRADSEAGYNDTRSLVQMRQKRDADGVHRAKELLKNLQVRFASKPNCRMARELPLMESIIFSLETPEPMTATEYGQYIEAGIEREAQAASSRYAVGSMEDAYHILQQGPLRIPFVVPADCVPEQTVPPLDIFKACLMNKELVNVHLLGKSDGQELQYSMRGSRSSYPRSEEPANGTKRRRKKPWTKQKKGRSRPRYAAEAEFNRPLQMSGSAIVKTLEDDQCEDLPLNLLDLYHIWETKTPEAFDKLREFKILLEARGPMNAGKAIDESPLSSCASGWTIFSTAGAMSGPHRDHHHLVLAIRVESGSKLWPWWRPQTHEELLSWTTEIQPLPSGNPSAIELQPGDWLFLPGGTIHAPLSLVNTLMSGKQFWDLRELADVIQSTMFEEQFPHVTNEDGAADFEAKIKTVMDHYRKRSEIYPWPQDRADLEDCERRLQVSI